MLGSLNSGYAATAGLAAFLASAVEFVEALTVVLAIGAVRGWRGALVGTAGAGVVLLALVAAMGPALARIPLNAVQLVIGALLLLFGLRWLRKAILRAAGIIPLHDEEALFEAETTSLRGHHPNQGGLDAVAVLGAFKIVMVEGVEVVFIIIAIGVGGSGLLLPACLGAAAALVIVILLGLALHKPIAALPENTLKFLVGVILSAFGTFWAGEGIGVAWPGEDLALAGLVAAYLLVAFGAVWLAGRGKARVKP